MSCGVGCRHGSDPALLWLWCRPAAAVLIQALAWDPPCATSAALEEAKKKKVGVPVVAQQKRIQLGTMRLRVQSLASLSGLRIWHCHELWCRLQMWLRSCVAVAVV